MVPPTTILKFKQEKIFIRYEVVLAVIVVISRKTYVEKLFFFSDNLIC